MNLDLRLQPGSGASIIRYLPMLGVGACGLVLVLVLVCAVAGERIAPYDPLAQDLFHSLVGPSGSHWLGTDELGRDVLSRTIVGARTAMFGPAVIAFSAMVVGSVLGLVAGYRGGLIDAAILRLVDLNYALPGMLVVIVVVGAVGGGYGLALALLAFFFSPQDIRIVRAAALEQRTLPYVEAARALGLSQARIMFRHIWPNTLNLVVANTFTQFAYGLVGLSGLSFLGVGVPPGAADWGRMLADSRSELFENPWAAIAPALLIIVTAGAVNVLGDLMYERISSRGRVR